MNVLVFDISISGHHSEYIHHLVDYLNYHPSEDFYYFLLHPDFSKTFPYIKQKATQCSNIRFVEISSEEFDYSNSGGKLVKSIRYLRVLNKYAKKLSIQHAILMHFNLFQFGLSIYFPRYTVSGILLAQFYRLDCVSLKKKMLFLRKYLQTLFYSINPKIKKIFILNDQDSVCYFNQKFRTKKFQTLPDPIPDWDLDLTIDVRKKYLIAQNRVIFLHCGSLDERKGTLDILRSIDNIDINDQKKICFLFAGRACNKDLESCLNKMINYYNNSSSVQIIWESGFIANSILKCMFDQSDCVLIPYKNSESSSGILGHAVRSGKPVIGPDRGLLGELIKANKLGYVIEHPTNIASELCKFLNRVEIFARNESFFNDHAPVIFSEKVIQSSIQLRNKK